ncbi:translation initiation factor 3 subunit B [Strigomonas culicis]|uniref:Translation initiation factor 3 subunit B n=1 Tax=Strigomonas culicis TaxID=28005 RepID=S9VXJ3_9TRYP|nr:translation initiation factor 3 subunit B [Strigomonas culicis]|eukprot:EPY28360.1 translation initiation factor 3 subunit B [Strigomonas culicis]
MRCRTRRRRTSRTRPRTPEQNTEEEADFSHNMAEDHKGRPQFIVKGGLSLSVEWYWYDWEKGEPVIYRRPSVRKDLPIDKWTEVDRKNKELQKGLISSMLNQVRPQPSWSNYGYMMISEGFSGLQVWGGKNMNLLYVIPEKVTAYAVSPREQYIVIRTEKDISIMNFRTARKIQTLGNLDVSSEDLWPILRFSADDSLVAVCKPGIPSDFNNTDKPFAGKMSIFHSETMTLIQGTRGAPRSHTFEIPGLYKAEWNPQQGTQIAYVSARGENGGWFLVISNITVDKDNIAVEEILFQRIFATAQRLDILWHPAGTYLAVKATVREKRKGNDLTPSVRTEYALYNIGRDVAAFQMIVKDNYSASRFAWQPGGDLFAVILEETRGAIGTAALGENQLLQIYAVKDRKKLKMLAEFTTSATHLFWAPKGKNLVAVSFQKSLVTFININEFEHAKEVNKLKGVNLTDGQWDPTGRFFATWVSSLRETTMAPHYRIFDLNGMEVFMKESKPFSHFAWRPLPPTLLTTEEVNNVSSPQSAKQLLADYDTQMKELANLEKEKEEKKRHDQEQAYIKKMNDLARKMREQNLDEKRRDLRASSQWARYWDNRLKDLPEEQQYIDEDVFEERVIYRKAKN